MNGEKGGLRVNCLERTMNCRVSIFCMWFQFNASLDVTVNEFCGLSICPGGVKMGWKTYETLSDSRTLTSNPPPTLQITIAESYKRNSKPAFPIWLSALVEDFCRHWSSLFFFGTQIECRWHWDANQTQIYYSRLGCL